ncbi:aldehyde:ferredoxin oxidoreductase [Candidatus Magnetomorum sp. HK-1]|nr:aldehyde:ferredoxin oxidoreductase [Candidatus Magnetomorum sp. HK-1]
MHGWTGKIAHINLLTKTISVETPTQEIYEKWIGGRGLAGYYLRPYITHEWHDPEMPLCLFTGPLTATSAPTSGRMTIMSRSPLTGTIGDSSVGGSLGRNLKRAGWDGIVISGKHDSLCGIEIQNDNISIVSAKHLAGLVTSKVYVKLKQKGSVACIGPAAENGVRFASVIVDQHHAAGRNGLGLIFASKNIKYITVLGHQRAKIYDKDGLKKGRKDALRLVAASPILSGEQGLMNFGTGALFDLIHVRRMMPTSNFRKTFFDPAQKMNAFAYGKKYPSQQSGCKGCHILCKRKQLAGGVLPEFETMSHFSALSNNTDMQAVVSANRLCNEMGMDTISAAATLSAYAESKNITLDSQQIIDLLNDISFKKGPGFALAEGSHDFCKKNQTSYSMSVKSQELPAYDPRGAYGMALAYATSTRGGCHLRAYPISHEILRKPSATDRFSWSGKARMIKLSEDTFAVIDSLIACKFIFFAASLEEYAQIYTSVTGVPTSTSALQKIGERIIYHERMMNALNGFCDTQDDLPDRFFKESGTKGHGISIPPLSRSDFLEARKKYYRIRGLSDHGMPREDTARDLSLDESIHHHQS